MGYWLEGKAPRSQAGRSVGFGSQTWCNLWTYALEVDPETAGEMDEPFVSEGQGLDDEESSLLGSALLSQLDSLELDEYLREISQRLEPCPCDGNNSDCYYCKGTGRRPTPTFAKEDLRQLGQFLIDCGGFSLH